MHEALQLRTVAKLNIHEFENFKRDVKSNKREIKYLWYVRETKSVILICVIIFIKNDYFFIFHCGGHIAY